VIVIGLKAENEAENRAENRKQKTDFNPTSIFGIAIANFSRLSHYSTVFEHLSGGSGQMHPIRAKISPRSLWGSDRAKLH